METFQEDRRRISVGRDGKGGMISGAFHRLAGDAPDLVVESSPKRVRAYLGGETVADSRRVRLIHQRGSLPAYYFPREDVRDELLEPTDHTTHCPVRGEARYWTVRVGEKVAENAAWNYHDPPDDVPDIGGLLSFRWSGMDRWFEEDEEVFVHPRDPYHRIDVLESSRHVEVRVGDVTVAESRRPVMLMETGLPVRYYLPKVDVRTHLLQPSDTRTECPYKGRTSAYWSAGDLGEGPGEEDQELAWCYDFPLEGLSRIAGRIAFYHERVELLVDGEPYPNARGAP
jgi:uncharacterized protein (DUF427 family)